MCHCPPALADFGLVCPGAYQVAGSPVFSDVPRPLESWGFPLQSYIPDTSSDTFSSCRGIVLLVVVETDLKTWTAPPPALLGTEVS